MDTNFSTNRGHDFNNLLAGTVKPLFEVAVIKTVDCIPEIFDFMNIERPSASVVDADGQNFIPACWVRQKGDADTFVFAPSFKIPQ